MKGLSTSMIKALLLVFLLSYHIQVEAKTKFQSRKDKEIVMEVLTAFSRQCNYTSSVEQSIVTKLEDNLKKAQNAEKQEVLACYSEYLTKISSTNYIYSKICKELTQDGNNGSDEELMRLFVGVQKYRRGIRLQHSILNDCLREKNAPAEYIVDLDSSRIESQYLKKRIESMTAPRFHENRTDYR
jgi:hypothetical protein